MNKKVKEIVHTKEVTLENFINIYLSDMKGIFLVSGEVEQSILEWMWKETDYNNSNVVMDNFAKTDISKKFNIKVQSVSDAITRLVKKGVVTKDRRLFYRLNKNLFPSFDKEKDSFNHIISVTYNLK